MPEKTVYFKNNLFSSGVTDITDREEQLIGSLDLHSMWSARVTVKLQGGAPVHGGFRMFSGKWYVEDSRGTELGVVKAKLSLLSKRYEYERRGHGTFYVESPVFSREYTVKDGQGRQAAVFQRVTGIFSVGGYELINRSKLPTEELICVVMGIYAIQAANSS